MALAFRLHLVTVHDSERTLECEDLWQGAGLTILTAEEHNALGRSDIETTVGDTHWDFEFKYVKKDVDAREALNKALGQIQKKHYGKSSPAQFASAWSLATNSVRL